MSRLRVKWCCWRHRTLSKTSPKIHMERNVWFSFWKRTPIKDFFYFSPRTFGEDEAILTSLFLNWVGDFNHQLETVGFPTDRCGLSIAQPGFWVVLSIIVVEGGPTTVTTGGGVAGAGWGGWQTVGEWLDMEVFLVRFHNCRWSSIWFFLSLFVVYCPERELLNVSSIQS